MKKLSILLSTLLMSGCFICHKNVPQPAQPPMQEPAVEAEEVAVEEFVIEQVIEEQKTPVKEENVISRYSIPEAANFYFGSTEVRPDMNKIDELEEDIKANPTAVILVEGHTDNVGSDEFNKQLSLERAQTVAQIIAERGYPNTIRVYGAGKDSPIASNETGKGRAQNRRVDVVLVKGEE